MTNWDYYEAVQRFQRILEAEGIIDRLRDFGAIEGDLIMIGEILDCLSGKVYRVHLVRSLRLRCDLLSR